MGSIKTGTFIHRDAPAGHHQLVLLTDPFPRASHLEFDAAPGRTYVYRIEMNDLGQRMRAMGAAAGLAGALVAGAVSAATSDCGSYDFVPVDVAALAEIRLVE